MKGKEKKEKKEKKSGLFGFSKKKEEKQKFSEPILIGEHIPFQGESQRLLNQTTVNTTPQV